MEIRKKKTEEGWRMGEGGGIRDGRESKDEMRMEIMGNGD